MKSKAAHLLLKTIVLVFIYSNVCICQEEWTWRHPLPTGNHLHKAIWTGSQYVIVGGAGTILTSSDGKIWDLKKHFTQRDLLGITYTGTYYVSVGDSGTVLTSKDAETWKLQNTETNIRINSIVNSNNYFIAAGNSGIVLSTNNPIVWSIQYPITGCELNSLVSTGDKILAVGTWGKILLSRNNGQSWEIENSGTQKFLTSVTWNGSQFTAVGFNGTVLNSKDGVTWENSTNPIDFYISDITYIGQKYFALTARDTLLISNDGVSWQPQSMGLNMPLSSILWNGNKMLCTGYIGAIALSEDTGKTWNLMSKHLTGWLTDIACSDNMVVAVGANGTIMTSEDGSTWKLRNTGLTNNLYNILWTGSKFVAQIGDEPKALISDDGIAWSINQTNLENLKLNRLINVTTASDKILAVGEYGSIKGSKDGITWSTRFANVVEAELFDIAWSGNLFVAVGDRGITVTSTDGLVWDTQTVSDCELSSVVWTGKEFITQCGASFLSSADGKIWNNYFLGPDFENIRKIRYYENGLLAIGKYGFVATSEDGITWKKQSSNASVILGGIIQHKSQYILIGEGGAILTAPVRPVGIKNKKSANSRIPAGINALIKGSILTYSISRPVFLEIKIIDLKGRTIAAPLKKSVQAGEYAIDFNKHGISSGCYLVSIMSDGIQLRKRIVLSKHQGI